MSITKNIKAGFTLVELLIVISVIGILAAIVVVSYNGVQKKGQDAAVQSDLEGVAAQLEAHRLRSTPKVYPNSTATLETLSIKASKPVYDTTIPANFIYCVENTTLQSFAVVGQSKSGAIFLVTQDGLATNTYVTGDLTPTFCNTRFGAGWTQLSGMYPANTWQAWVGS